MVQVTVPANTQAGAQINFDDQQQLQSYIGGQMVFIRGINLIPISVLSNSPLTTGLANAAAVDIPRATLNLVIRGRELIKDVPLAMLNPIIPDNAGTYIPAQFNYYLLRNVSEVDWTKSYFRMVAAPTATAFAYILLVHYSYTPDGYVVDSNGRVIEVIR